jgi:hypothetical protein
MKVPKLIKSFLSFILRSRVLSFILGLGSKPDPLTAEFYSLLHMKTVLEERQLVEARDIYRAGWHKKWTEGDIDFVLTVSHPLPAFENGRSDRVNLMTTGYNFIFNIVSQSRFFIVKSYIDAAFFSLIMLPV